MLCIEDEDAICELITATLTGEGYEIICKTNGAGLAQAMHRQPALILLDLMMSPMDGWTVRRKLLEFGPTADVPVVLMTALNNSPQWQEDLRCVGLLQKPFHINALVRIVRSIVGPAQKE